MAKKTLSAKEVWDDIKAGMNNAALMEKYQLSEKGVQSLFKKLVDGGVLKPEELETRAPSPEKPVETTWLCPICGNPQNTHYDKCPECSVIAARFHENIATSQQLGAIAAGPSPVPEEFEPAPAPTEVFVRSNFDKIKEVLSNPYGLAVAAAAALLGFVIGMIFSSSTGWLK
jgi:hypothetical protein